MCPDNGVICFAVITKTCIKRAYAYIVLHKDPLSYIHIYVWAQRQQRKVVTTTLLFPPPPSSPGRSSNISGVQILKRTPSRSIGHVALPYIEISIVAPLMCSSCSRHSAIAHVNKLSPETLAYIFDFLRVLDCPHCLFVNDGRKEPYIGWVLVTYVCRRWRSIALDDPRLWSVIPVFLGPLWTQEFLQRARTVPITVDNVLAEHRMPGAGSAIGFVDFVLRHFHRMKEIGIAASASELAPIFPSLQVAAPVLEKFCMHNNGGHLPLLPTVLFNQTAPRLRFIDIQQFDFMWSSLTFSGLVELSLFRSPHSTTAPKSEQHNFRQFLLALSKMPALEKLSLCHTLPLPPVDTTCDVAPITLPRLQDLSLTDDGLKCVVALKHIVTPFTTNHWIDFVFSTVNMHDIEQAYSWFISRIGTFPPNPFALLLEPYEARFSVAWEPSLSGMGLDEATHEPTYELTFHGVESMDETFAELETICMAMPLARMKRLTIDLPYRNSWTTQEWFSIFGKCEKVRELEIYDYCTTDILQALASVNPTEGLSRPLFPSLDYMSLGSIDCKNHRRMCEKVVTWLTLRQRMDPLRELDFVDCTPMADDLIHKLQDIIPEVGCQYWDDRDFCCCCCSESEESEGTSISGE
ncbi:hypothetical protein DENSPDRAFT_842853 [Dentipellis sp. KUC8613]|nr:hypothetical protein DENSPDRAFT_842853 [Dentipellis sp. KUC8613]